MISMEQITQIKGNYHVAYFTNFITSLNSTITVKFVSNQAFQRELAKLAVNRIG